MVELTDPYANVTKRGLDVAGSLSIRVDGQRLDGEYVDIEGKVLDHFTILKGEGKTSGLGGTGGAGGSGGNEASSDSSDDGGCGCRFANDSPSAYGLAWLALLLAFRRRRAA